MLDAEHIAIMMMLRQISLLCLLLSLFTVTTSSPVKENVSGLVKPGECPPERYYNRNESEITHKLCQNDRSCTGSMKCCPDNGDMMCKPPAQEKPGMCPTFTESAGKCNDNCTSDSECPGNKKCCPKACGKTCVPSLSDLGKPTQAPTQTGFCPQEQVLDCGRPERTSCDDSSCLEGYKCCPVVCRVQCQKTVPERSGECPAADTECTPGANNGSCQSDHDCKTLFKCCSTKCGKRCVEAKNVPFPLYYNSNTSHLG